MEKLTSGRTLVHIINTSSLNALGDSNEIVQAPNSPFTSATSLIRFQDPCAQSQCSAIRFPLQLSFFHCSDLVYVGVCSKVRTINR